MPVTDADIDALNLAPTCKQAAIALRTACPAVVFTSGRRTPAQQASAIPANIVKSKDRQWIAKTYATSSARDACQGWVDEHPDATTQGDLAGGLAGVLGDLDDDQLARLSRHLAGMAFDVQPVADADGGAAIKAAIAKLDGLDKFLDKEGGLTVWHAQFSE